MIIILFILPFPLLLYSILTPFPLGLLDMNDPNLAGIKAKHAVDIFQYQKGVLFGCFDRMFTLSLFGYKVNMG